ncbi:hypothetical protein HDU98_009753 [Podochytrium sp. JEL0797]|nr:hypothetical protein HDU98_009753 [Podochytrium sp. JEL0797]
MLVFANSSEAKPLLSQNTNASYNTLSISTQPRSLIFVPERRYRGISWLQIIFAVCALLFIAPRLIRSWSDMFPIEFGADLPLVEGAFSFDAASFSSVSIDSQGAFGSTDIDVRTGSGPDAAVSFTIASNDAQAQNQTSVTATLESNTLVLRVLFPQGLVLSRNRKLHTALSLTLPKDLAEFSTTAEYATLLYSGPNVSNSFTSRIETGSVTTLSTLSTSLISITCTTGSISLLHPLESDTLHLETTTGSIHTNTAHISTSVHLNSQTGSIDTSATGAYTHFEASTNDGSLTLELNPSSSSTVFKLVSGFGSIKAFVTGFKGRYVAESSLGDVKVSGRAVRKTTSMVGEDELGKGEFAARSKRGSVTLLFN